MLVFYKFGTFFYAEIPRIAIFYSVILPVHLACFSNLMDVGCPALMYLFLHLLTHVFMSKRHSLPFFVWYILKSRACFTITYNIRKISKRTRKW